MKATHLEITFYIAIYYILVRGNAPAPRKPEVQNDDKKSFQTPDQSRQGPTKF